MITQIFNQCSDDLYNTTRFASSETFKTAIKKIFENVNDNVSILILGCFNGKNDLFNLIDEIEVNEKYKYEIYAVDNATVHESNEPITLKYINSALLKRNFKLIKNGKDFWFFIKKNIEINIFFSDIEDYKKEIFEKKFDVIISFFVLQHITNWLICVQKIYDSLKKKGEFFLVESTSITAKALENNKLKDRNFEPDKLSDWIYKFHQRRFESFGIIYLNTLLGTNTKFLKKNLKKNFYYYKELEIIEQKIFTKESINIYNKIYPFTYAASFYGTKINIYKTKINKLDFKNISKDYLLFIDTFYQNFNKKVCISKKQKVKASLILHKFEKKDSNKDIFINSVKSLYKNACNNISELLDYIELSYYDKTLTNKIKILYQIILANQILINKTKSFNIYLYNRFEFKTFGFLINSKNFETHLVNTISFSYYVEKVIRVFFEFNVNSIIKLTNSSEFNCEILKLGNEKYIIISLPDMYLNFNTKNLNLKTFKDLNVFMLKNFIYVEPKNRLDNVLENSELENIFNIKNIKSDISKIKKILLENFYEEEDISKKINELSLILPFLSYICKFGVLVNLNIKIDANCNYISSFLEENMNLNDFYNGKNHLDHRIDLLKQIILFFAKKTSLINILEA